MKKPCRYCKKEFNIKYLKIHQKNCKKRQKSFNDEIKFETDSRKSIREKNNQLKSENMESKIYLEPEMYRFFHQWEHSDEMDKYKSFEIRNLLLGEFGALGDEDTVSISKQKFTNRWGEGGKCPQCNTSDISQKEKELFISLAYQKDNYITLRYSCNICGLYEEFRWIESLLK